MNAIKGFLGLGSNSGPQVGSPVPPPAAINAAQASASAPTPLKNLNKEKIAALKPAGVSMPNASAAPVAAAAAGGDFSDYIGGARRRKNLRKKYKMPGRRAATRKNRKANAVSRKARKATRKNRKASRKNRK